VLLCCIDLNVYYIWLGLVHISAIYALWLHLYLGSMLATFSNSEGQFFPLALLDWYKDPSSCSKLSSFQIWYNPYIVYQTNIYIISIFHYPLVVIILPGCVLLTNVWPLQLCLLRVGNFFSLQNGPDEQLAQSMWYLWMQTTFQDQTALTLENWGRSCSNSEFLYAIPWNI
jgi:hypothetical protein